jgi:protein-tyrosine phosphatase
MLRIAAAAGTTDIAATSHASPQFRFDPRVASETVDTLRAMAGKAPRIHSGCELHLTPEHIQAACRHPDEYSIAGRGYLLLEFSDFLVPRTSAEILGRLLSRGLRPIIAHPERNRLLRGNISRLEAWVDLGCLVQITAQSLNGHFGPVAKASAWDLIRRGLVHVIASDAHDCKHRPPVLAQALEAVTAGCGIDTARELFIENPGAIVAGSSVQKRSGCAPKRRWFSFAGLPR